MTDWMPLLLKTVLISLPVSLIGLIGSRLLRSAPWKRQRNFINLVMAALLLTPLLVWVGPTVWQVTLPPPQDQAPLLISFSHSLTIQADPAAAAPPRVGTVLILVWLLGILAGSLQLLWGIVCVQLHIRDSSRLEGVDISEKLAWGLGIAGDLPLNRIRLSSRIKGPAAAGFIRAWILIPRLLFRHMDAREFRAVVLHEWAHIRNRDGLFTLLGELTGMLYWWNPVVRMLQRRRLLLQEMIGDETAIETAGELEYARALLSLAEKSRHDEALKGVLAFFGPLSLKERIERILSKEGKMNLRKMKLGVLFIGGLALALTLAASGTRFVASSTISNEPTQDDSKKEQSEPVPIPTPPKLIKQVVPTYPQEARKNRVSSTVFVEIIIDEMGEVRKARVKSGHSLFNEAALQAVQQWRFEPTVLNDKAIAVKVTVPVVFKLSEKDAKAVSKTEKASDIIKVANVNAPKLIRRVEPEYPQAALKARVQGQVILEATTDVYGRIAGVKTIVPSEKDNPAPEYRLLADAAASALKQWLYEPYIVDGTPRPVRFTVILTFKLGEGEKKPEQETSGSPAKEEKSGEVQKEPVEETVITKPEIPTKTKVEKPSTERMIVSLSSKEAPKLIRRVEPEYPSVALKSRTSGEVTLDVTIDEKGRVITARSISGDPLLNEASREAVRKWRYRPFLLDGKAVAARFPVTLTYKLGRH